MNGVVENRPMFTALDGRKPTEVFGEIPTP